MVSVAVVVHDDNIDTVKMESHSDRGSFCACTFARLANLGWADSKFAARDKDPSKSTVLYISQIPSHSSHPSPPSHQLNHNRHAAIPLPIYIQPTPPLILPSTNHQVSNQQTRLYPKIIQTSPKLTKTSFSDSDIPKNHHQSPPKSQSQNRKSSKITKTPSIRSIRVANQQLHHPSVLAPLLPQRRRQHLAPGEDPAHRGQLRRLHRVQAAGHHAQDRGAVALHGGLGESGEGDGGNMGETIHKFSCYISYKLYIISYIYIYVYVCVCVFSQGPKSWIQKREKSYTIYKSIQIICTFMYVSR